MFLAPRELQRMSPEIITVSGCCNAPVSAFTPDDYTKLNPLDGDTMVMSLRYICNKCGQECTITDVTK